MTESDALLRMGKCANAAEVALHGLRAAGQAGLKAWVFDRIPAANAAVGLLASGRTAEAAAVIDPLTAGPPDRDHWLVHQARAEIDLLRGHIEAAAGRRQQIKVCVGHIGSIEHARESAQRAAELALWAGRPGDALAEARRVLPLFEATDLTIFCGRLLTAGLRACGYLPNRPGRAATNPPPTPPRPTPTP